MRNFELTEKEVADLKATHRKIPEKYAADRIKAIVLLGTDWSLEEVSEALLLDAETLRNYVNLYKMGGVKKLVERHYKGSLSKLSSEELKELKSHLTEVTYLTVAEIIAYIKKRYGKKYTVSGMTDLLHRLGFSHKKPSMSACKVDVVKQLEFLQKYEKIRRSGKPVYSLDGCHPQHNSMPQYGWILKGKTKLLPSNTGRKRVNIQGAINLDTHFLVSTTHETLDKQSTIDILKKIEKRHAFDKKIYILVDNAGYYRSKEVRKHLKKSKIELVFLPPYAPHLSLIERVWRYFKKKVLYNKYYATFKDFTEAINNFLGISHRKAFKNLLTEAFHFVDPDSTMLQLAA